MTAKKTAKTKNNRVEKLSDRIQAPKIDAKLSLLTDGDQALEVYRIMSLIRRFEERAGQLYGMGLIGGFCHLYIGQEAVVTGMKMAWKSQDSIIASYRDHGHMLACGMAPDRVMAELTGRASGYSKGKGGSMHMFSLEKKFYGGHGIVGGQVSLGTGLGFAHKYRDDKGAAFVFYGEGAANQGQVYESFNLAALWQLPVIYIIENNRYAMGTSIERSAASLDYFRRGEALSIPGMVVDGQDVDAVYRSAVAARNYVQRRKGPILLEVRTYRYRGHSMSDPSKYRSKSEVDTMRAQHDPIKTWEAKLLKNKIKAEQLKEIQTAVNSIVDKAVEFAKASPEPEQSELYTDVLVD